MDFCEDGDWVSFEVYGGLAVEGLILVYLFCVMMVLTDEYLMGTSHTEYIHLTIHRYHLSIEAGACLVPPTQIAFGSICPEFTVNTVASVLMSSHHSVLGLSTIVGSGCFGTPYSDFTMCLAIASFVAGWTHGAISFPLKVVMKDYVKYVVCLLLVIWIVSDGEVSFMESFCLLLLTPVYTYFNFTSEGSRHSVLLHTDSLEPLDKSPPSFLGRFFKSPTRSVCSLILPQNPRYFWQLAGAFVLIVCMGFAVTRTMVFFLQRMMCHVSIPESLVGLTIISWGNNIGDLMNSAVAAKRGNALLSIEAVLSTQVLNMIFSLGLPWTISTAFFGPMHQTDSTTRHSLYFAILIVCLSFLAVVISCEKMHTRLGAFLLLIYIFYVISEWTLLSQTTKID